jgi:outer membrane protein assembly factor BamB
VVAERRVYVPDRAYLLTIIDADTGERVRAIPKTSAVSLGNDGESLFLRRTHGVSRIDASGEILWDAQIEAGYLPTLVRSAGGRVYVTSDRGLLSCLSAETGEILHQYQITPRMWVMASPVVDDGTLYVSAMDGSVTALHLR